jgi:hypothetical protein
MARFIQGTCGLANIDNDDRVRAEDVTYDNSAGLFPPGTDTVQEALEAAGGGGAVADMTPTVSGLAFGSQDQTKQLNSLGEGVSIDTGTNRATARYNAESAGTPQAALYSNCIFDDNRSTQTAGTSTSDAITTVNGGDISDSQYVTSITTTNNANTSVTNVGDSIFQANLGSIKSAQVLNSIVVANGSTLDTSTFDRACLQVSGLTAAGIGFEGATMLGSLTTVGVTEARESMFLASNAGVAIDQQGRQSLYVGNQTANEVITDRDAYISSYDRFFLRTLRAGTGPNVAMYDPSTAELTYDSLAASLPAKQPTTQGAQFGINSSGNASDVNGRDSFSNYAAGPVQLTGVSSVGNNQYTGSSPATTSFTNVIALGRLHSFLNASSISDSMIACNIIASPTITSITESNIVAPRAGSVTLSYSGPLTGFNCHSSGSISCSTDPLYSTVLSSGGTVNPNITNLVLSAQPAAGSIVMAGSGNTLIQSSGTGVIYNHAFSNCCVLANGATPVVPLGNDQLVSNHSAIRVPNLGSTAIVSTSFLPVAHNGATGLVQPILSPLFSRVYRAIAATVAGGAATFTIGSGINPSTSGYGFQATIRNTSGTVAYVGQIQNVSATSVTIQVFSSVNAVAGAPTMAPAPAGIIVHFCMQF